MSTSRFALVLAILTFPTPSGAQAPLADSRRKTIEISATEKIQVIAEVATIKLGYQNQAATKDTAYEENTRVANKVLQALLEAGVPKDSIESETLSLEQDQDRYGVRPQKPVTFWASQKWSIRSKAAEAQKIVDIAVAAGANLIENVEWSVADPKQLETKAYAAAIKRARELAEQTASQTGLRLGEIISVVNSANPVNRFGTAEEMAVYAQLTAPKRAVLKLQPGTVEREASVTVTYAIVP